MVALRRDFHMHPEIGFEVERTAGIVADELKKYGLSVKTEVGKTGVVADLHCGAKKTIALRADMDALPIQEMSEVPYKSKIPMRAHLCGHDAHTALLLGTAETLSSMECPVNVRFIFQPSEEVWPGGAPAMIKDGALDGVDEIYAFHVWPTLPVGHYGVCLGPAMAQPDAFDIKIRGKGGHAAAPHTAVDPIVIASELVQRFQTIISRNLDPSESAVLTVTQLHAGSAYNVIPEECSLSGTVRTYTQEAKGCIVKRMHEIVESYEEPIVIDFQYMDGYPATVNHEREACWVAEVATNLVGENRVDFPAQKVMFGEDFAYYLEKVKGCFIHLGCRNGELRMLHDPRFDLDEACMEHGVALFVQLIREAR